MKRQKHSLSHHRLLTCDMGKLVPIGCLEVLPGDTFQHSTSMLARVSPLVTPVMHPVNVRIHHFFVPTRIIWDGFQEFITGGPDGNNADTIPQMVINDTHANGVTDYLGYPIPGPGKSYSASSLPTKAYDAIYNEYYRDQDLCPERDGSSGTLATIAWEKDYLTSARPFAQKGSNITVPISGGDATVKGRNGMPIQFENLSNTNVPEGSAQIQRAATTGDLIANPATASLGHLGGNVDDTNLWADLTDVANIDLATMREAFAEQRYMEARARYGSRYTEYLAYLGVKSSDARLQRPEYLGGGKQTISFSEVLKTGSGEEPTDPIGNMSGHGIAALRSNKYRKFFEEHGYVITMLSIRPKAMYIDGLPRQFSRLSKEDFYQKELELVGQQEILNKEVYIQGDATDENTFGYADRYREYREHPSQISAEMRGILDSWHMARKFDAQPVLNQSFVECDPTKRIHAEQTNHAMWITCNHSIQARRMVKRNPVARII